MVIKEWKRTPGQATVRGYARPEALVDAGWLARHLEDPDLRLVEVDVSAKAYAEGHLPGAVLWNVYRDLKDVDYRLIDRAATDDLVARTGIHRDSKVVFYGYAPALAFWLMKLYGHSDVRILDCSRDAWRAAGHPWSTATPEPAAAGYPLGDEDPRIRADRAAVQDAIGAEDTLLLDVRSEAEYLGERFWPSGSMEPDGRAGHVPSAVHQPIDDLYDGDGAFRHASNLRSLFRSVDLDGTDEIITYCTIGGRAATAWFTLTYLLGREHVRVYDGSWAEWGKLAGAPVATGPNRI
jgi:thiosulfate/3-mercaptopyruvate sulfurtransferase